jgi:hypothetical protein
VAKYQLVLLNNSGLQFYKAGPAGLQQQATDDQKQRIAFVKMWYREGPARFGK